MKERRENAHNNKTYDNDAGIGEHDATRQCMAGSISKKDVGIECRKVITRTREKISLKMARSGRSFLTKIICWRDNFVGMAFCPEAHYELPVSDIEERLRKSEKKKRQLQRRINQLLDEG